MTTKNRSLLGYSQKYLISQLTKSLCKGDYEASCYWSANMHVSGWIQQWWIAVISFCATYIHISNPKLPKLLWTISTDYPDIKGGQNTNSSEIRQSIALVIGVCTFSKKDMPLNNPKALSLTPHDLPALFDSIEKTPFHILVCRSSLKNDSQFLIQLFSQFACCIDKNDFYGAIKIISICLYLEKNKAYKNKLVCSNRIWKGLPYKLTSHWYLFIWDILSNLAQQKGIPHIIGSWKALYITNCNYSKLQSLCPYILNCISLLTHSIDLNTQCIRNEYIVSKGCSNIDYIYGYVLQQYATNSN